MRAACAPTLLLLIALAGCTRDAGAPERSSFATRAPPACREAMQRVASQAPGEGTLRNFLTACSSTLFAEPGCRTAWERSATVSRDTVRLRMILKGCAPAACSPRASPAALCDPTPRWASASEVLAQWPEFQRAQFPAGFGAEEARHLEAFLTLMLYGWSNTPPPGFAPRRTLRFMLREDETELLLRDERAQQLGRWTTRDTWSPTQRGEFNELIRYFPKAKGPGELCARIDAHPDVKFLQLKPIFEALQAANCGQYDVGVLVKLPVPAK